VVPANRLPACFFTCHLRKTGVLACLSRYAVVPANRLPACFFTCHLRKTGVLACLSRYAVVPANRLPACFFTCHLRKTGVLACLGKQASSLFLIYPPVLNGQTTESHMMMTASRTILEKFSR